MLSIAKDYIPYDGTSQKKHSIQKEYRADTLPNIYDAALSLGLSKTYFSSKTKNIRLMRLLGAGNVKIGYEKYMQLIDQLIEAFNSMNDVLDNRVWGFKVFDHFAGHTERRTQRLKYEIDHHGITNYKKIRTVHKILKSFKTLEHIRKKPLMYIPIGSRLALTEKFVKKYYWNKKLTTDQIAVELGVPEIHVQKEIKRLGLQKKENGIKLRGKKGFVMPKEQRVKHRNQPHARAVVQIDPETFKVLRAFNSTGAVERDGWSRESVRKAIKRAGLHDGFLWAYEGEEDEMVQRAKAKGDLTKKLNIWKNGKVSKESIQELYIDQGMNKDEVAAILGCTPGTVACCASRFKLSKQINISTETLKRLYIDEGMQAKEIAEMYGYSPASISTYLCKRGITRKKHV